MSEITVPYRPENSINRPVVWIGTQFKKKAGCGLPRLINKWLALNEAQALNASYLFGLSVWFGYAVLYSDI